MCRQPVPVIGWLWRALMALLILAGLGVWHGDHCAGDAYPAHTRVTVTDHPAIEGLRVNGPAQLVAAVTPAQRGDLPPFTLGAPHTAAGDCHLVTSTEPAIPTAVTSVAPQPGHFTGVILGEATWRPVQRLLTRRPLAKIGVSRT